MSADADRLDSTASTLADCAWRLDDRLRRLTARVEEQVIYARLGWKGPAASNFMQATHDRANRMRRARDEMNSLVGQMRRQATILREEERRQMASRRR